MTFLLCKLLYNVLTLNYVRSRRIDHVDSDTKKYITQVPSVNMSFQPVILSHCMEIIESYVTDRHVYISK